MNAVVAARAETLDASEEDRAGWHQDSIRRYSLTGRNVRRDCVHRRLEVREGALDELKAGLKDLADFVEAKEPQLIAYNVYFSDDGTRMTVVNVHPNSASLEYHLEVAGPLFRQFVELVTLSSIHIYGEPSEKALRQAHEKARLLGGGAVEVEAFHAGFTRLAAQRPRRQQTRL